MIRSLFIIILFSPIVLYGQCLEGDCENDRGIKQTEIIKYEGDFKNGEYHGLGKVYKIKYNKEGENLYSKEEKILFDGEFENGRIISGKSYNENEELEFDGRYSYSDGYRYYNEGKSYRDNQLIYHGEFLNGTPNGKGIRFNNGIKYLEGKFINGNFVEGKTFDENGELIYDGGYFTDDKYFYRHGQGILYEDGWEYKVKYNKNTLIENTYSSDDISGSNMDYTIIELEQEGLGRNLTFEININGKTQTYFFDTGAETFDISPSMEKHLIDTGIINQDDYYPSIEIVGFNNEIEKSRRVWINNVRIGDYLINNVLATINNDDNDPLLCGLALLELKFSAVTWNNDRSTDSSTLILYK